MRNIIMVISVLLGISNSGAIGLKIPNFRSNYSKIQYNKNNSPTKISYATLGILFVKLPITYDQKAINVTLGFGDPNEVYKSYFESTFKEILLNKTKFSRVRYISDTLSLIEKTLEFGKKKFITLKCPEKPLASSPVCDVQYLLLFENYDVSLLRNIDSIQSDIGMNPYRIWPYPLKNHQTIIENEIHQSADVIMFNCQNDSIVFYGKLKVKNNFTLLNKGVWEKSIKTMERVLFNKTPFADRDTSFVY